MKDRRKESFKSGGARSNETINQIICAIKKMYRDIGIDMKYITWNEYPTFKYLPKTREKKQKRILLIKMNLHKSVTGLNTDIATRKE